MKKLVALHNLGCKVNAYETEALAQMLTEAGYILAPFEAGADIYIINTCTVTNIADRKSRQMLHKAKKMNPDAVVVAMGCYVQSGKEKLEKDDAIDVIVGNNKKSELIDILEEYQQGKSKREAVTDADGHKEYEKISLSAVTEHTRAYLKVQDGCNQFCSYCIIPHVRGRSRSRKKEDVLEEVRRLQANGYREFVLAGIHLSSYGLDCNESLLSLIQAIHRLEGVERIRLGSLEPRIITEEFARSLADMEKICPHFHLSLQSGCDATLQRMNRRYDSSEYRDKCKLLRKYFANPALTTDIIVGFPGESQEDFQDSYDFVESVHFYETHIFKFSSREGTRAAAMDGCIPESEKTNRSKRMIALGQLHKKEYMDSFMENVSEVLIEEEIKYQGEQYWVGYTQEYLRAAVKSERDLTNCMVTGKVCGYLNEDTLQIVKIL